MTEPHSDADDHYIADALYTEGKYKEALERYRLLAQAGSLNAQLRISRMYILGLGVPQDFDEARPWCQKAAEENDPLGQFFLSTVYSGQGHYQEAIEWLEKSAAQGYPPALYSLGWLYETGEGIRVDEDKAAGYYEQAAKMGHLLAYRQIALRMLKGKRGIVSIPQGLYLYIRFLWETIQLARNDPNNERLLWLGIFNSRVHEV